MQFVCKGNRNSFLCKEGFRRLRSLFQGSDQTTTLLFRNGGLLHFSSPGSEAQSRHVDVVSFHNERNQGSK